MRRLSISSLMAFVLISAVGLAALRNAGELWAGMMLLVAVAAVGVALMATVILRGKERYWWAGFAFFGGGYLALTVGPWPSNTIRPQLGTTHILKEAHSRITRGAPQNAPDLPGLRAEREMLAVKLREAAFSARTGNDAAVKATKREIAKLNQRIDAINEATVYDQFERVGHSLFALLAGLVGGMVATWFYTRRERAGTAAG
jgi:hypothetical protein